MSLPHACLHLDKIDRMAGQVQEIHTALFGAAGQGGLHRRVDALEQDVDGVKADLAEQGKWQARTVGFASGVSAVLTLLGAKLIGFLK